MNFKIKDGRYFLPKKVIDAEGYKYKLKMLLSDNKNKNNFAYYQVKEMKTGKFGILVCGVDNKGVSDFQIFYSCGEINYLYRDLNERLERE